MANSDRYDRLLMRQRGAGARSTTEVNFGLTVGHDASRQERQQMRQRGAGTRMIDNIDFKFSFPTPSESRRSTTRDSRQSSSRSRRSSRSTSVRSHEVSPARSQRSHSSATERTQDQKNSGRVDILADDVERTRKRRRIETSPAVREPSASTASANLQSLSDPFNAQNVVNNDVNGFYDPTIREPVVSFTGQEPEDGGIEREILPPMSENEANKENAIPGDAKQAPKRRKRKSIGQQRRKSRTKSLAVSVSGRGNVEDENLNSSDDATQKAPYESLKSSTVERQTQVASDVQGRSSSPADIPYKHRKKRKSIVIGRKKRRFSDRSRSLNVIDENQISEQTSDNLRDLGTQQRTTNFQNSQVPREEALDVLPLSGRRPTNGRNLKNSRPSTLPATDSSPQRLRNSDEEGDSDYIDEDQSPEPPTPAPPKRNRKHNFTDKQNPPSQNEGRPTQKKASSSGFPITTYRMTDIHHLPGIVQEVDVNQVSELDLQLSSDLFLDRSVPNAVDVLAQICRETVDSAIERILGQKEPTTSAAERRRKQAALEVFGRELDGRLFEMSAGVENRINLERRLRKSQRQKVDLQNQWIEIRKKREAIALECDHVRRQHWENEDISKERWKVSEAAQKCEIELERSENQDSEGLVYLLRTVGSKISNVSASNGSILERIKDFNSQLERMVSVLEGQRS